MVGKGPADRSPVGPGPAAARRASSAMVPSRRSVSREWMGRGRPSRPMTDRTSEHPHEPDAISARGQSHSQPFDMSGSPDETLPNNPRGLDAISADARRKGNASSLSLGSFSI